MPENGPTTTSEVATLALLYASGELPTAEAVAFEVRLGEDQAAREALAQAVHMSVPLTSGVPSRPTPAYRQRVRQRLRGGWGAWLLGRRNYRGHPLFYFAGGAAAA